ncbi:MAG: hypothetical protein GY869_05710 [Planctomycetes bacterium]|nr:hypothetical protein [Planctomycetota bacterium]
MKKHFWVLLIAFLITSILVLYWVTFTVRFNENALVTTFGKISRRVYDPGLNWKLPPPINSVMKFDRRIRMYQRVSVETDTSDLQPIVVTVYVNWRIGDNIEDFYNSFYKRGMSDAESLVYKAEETIDTWIAEASNIISEYKLSELITLDRDQFKLDDMVRGSESSMLVRLREKAQVDVGYGIEIEDVGLEMLGVPDTVTEKVFARMASERQKESTRLIGEGKREADSIYGRAQGQAKIITAQAEAEAEKIRAEGDAESLQYLEVLNKNPELANTLRSYKTMSRILGDRTTFIFNSDSIIYKLLQEGPDISFVSPGQEEKKETGDGIPEAGDGKKETEDGQEE